MPSALGYDVRRHEHHGEVGLRVHVHLVQHEPGQGRELGLVDPVTRLVRDVGAHCRLPSRTAGVETS
jgi:hypothetical protein